MFAVADQIVPIAQLMMLNIVHTAVIEKASVFDGKHCVHKVRW